MEGFRTQVGTEVKHFKHLLWNQTDFERWQVLLVLCSKQPGQYPSIQHPLSYWLIHYTFTPITLITYYVSNTSDRSPPLRSLESNRTAWKVTNMQGHLVDARIVDDKVHKRGTTNECVSVSGQNTSFIELRRYCIFYIRKVCGNPASSIPVGIVFTNICSLHVSVSHFGIYHDISNFSLLLYLLSWTVIIDLWCYFGKKIMTCWRFKWWLANFSNEWSSI